MLNRATSILSAYPDDEVEVSGQPEIRTQSNTAVNDEAWNPFQVRLGQPNLQAIAHRRAARLNASSIDPTEHELLLKERAALLEQKFNGGLTRQQERRLNFVRWSLDRIQDARHGHQLDELEAAIEMYERLGAEIDRLLQQLHENVMGKKRR